MGECSGFLFPLSDGVPVESILQQLELYAMELGVADDIFDGVYAQDAIEALDVWITASIFLLMVFLYSSALLLDHPHWPLVCC